MYVQHGLEYFVCKKCISSTVNTNLLEKRFQFEEGNKLFDANTHFFLWQCKKFQNVNSREQSWKITSKPASTLVGTFLYISLADLLYSTIISLANIVPSCYTGPPGFAAAEAELQKSQMLSSASLACHPDEVSEGPCWWCPPAPPPVPSATCCHTPTPGPCWWCPTAPPPGPSTTCCYALTPCRGCCTYLSVIGLADHPLST